jgi:hypothetical protein
MRLVKHRSGVQLEPSCALSGSVEVVTTLGNSTCMRDALSGRVYALRLAWWIGNRRASFRSVRVDADGRCVVA